MSSLRLTLTVLLATAFLDVRVRADDPEAEAIKSAQQLLPQLGDDSFAKREEATRQMIALGEYILPTLRESREHRNPEIRRRVAHTMKFILLNSRIGKKTGTQTVLCEPGEFTMGSPRFENGRRAGENQHRVRITRHFLLGKYEVTQEEFAKYMNASPSWFSASGGGKNAVGMLDTSRFPVEMVTWFDAIEYCNQLSKADGFPPYYEVTNIKRTGTAITGASVKKLGGRGYRLPTEAEWEYACRAGTTSAFHFGGSNSGKDANTRPGPAIGYGGAPNWPALNRTSRVGSYRPNLWDLYDMHGNVGEWCWDYYERDYYDVSPNEDPEGPGQGLHRSQRGGSWIMSDTACRSASRYWHTPDERKEYNGFRIARSP